jgi:hypothetical protein
MAKVTAMVRFYYDQEFTVDVEDENDTEKAYELVDELASNIQVWDGNNAYTVEFGTYDIEL